MTELSRPNLPDFLQHDISIVARSSSKSVCGAVLFVLALAVTGFAGEAPLVFEGGHGAGMGKHIVFLAGDHEYRSEETLPALARILARHHGFKCTVLFNIDKETGE